MAKLLIIQPEFFERVSHVVIHTGTVKTVGEETPHQKLERKIVDALDVLVVVDRRGRNHPLDDHALNSL